MIPVPRQTLRRLLVIALIGCSTDAAEVGDTAAAAPDASAEAGAADCSLSCDDCRDLDEVTTCDRSGYQLFPHSVLERSTGCGLVGLTERADYVDCGGGTSYYDVSSRELVGVHRGCDGWFGEPPCGPIGRSIDKTCADVEREACTVCGQSACEYRQCVSWLVVCEADDACRALWECALELDCRDASCFGTGPCKTGTAFDRVPEADAGQASDGGREPFLDKPPLEMPNPVSKARTLAACLASCEDECPGRFGAR